MQPSDNCTTEQPKAIVIEVEGGAVVDVRNLPPGYCYEIIDHDDE